MEKRHLFAFNFRKKKPKIREVNTGNVLQFFCLVV